MVQPNIIPDPPHDTARKEAQKVEIVEAVKRSGQLLNRAILDAHDLGAPVDVKVQGGDASGSIPVVVVSRRPPQDLRS